MSDLPNYVANAFELVPATPFKPENTVFGFYTYLPWVRTGIAAAVTAPPPGEIRATATVHVAVEGAAVPQDVTQNLVVRGPGDVVSFPASQLIRRYPRSGAVKAEDSFLVHVEFARPDFPWIFSPAAAVGQQLSPWLVLVVLRDETSELAAGTGGLPDQVTTTLSELQPLDDSWAWAHAQVIGQIAGAGVASVDDRLTPDYAAVNLSRILCPRRLVSGERYRACLVPAYDAGVKTGLGSASGGTLDPAWTRAADGSDAAQQIVLPVYHSWTFDTTATTGDFKSLAERLVPIPAPWQIGRRVVDVAKPGGGLPPLGPRAQGRLETVRGPLVSPQLPNPASRDPDEVAAAAAETAAWPVAETEALRTLLNEPGLLAGKQGSLPADGLPLVGPEIYGHNQAAVTTVDPSRDADWLGQLNVLPVNRITAGLGTRVVQKDQEQIMQSAWAQVGEVDDANRQLRSAQLARFVCEAVHARNIAALHYSSLIQVTRPIHGRVGFDAASTLYAEVEGSAVPAAATSAAFRRSTRPSGPLARFAGGPGRAALNAVLGDEGQTRDFQRPYRELDCVSGISDAAARAVDPALAAAVLGIEAGDDEVVFSALTAQGRRLAETPSVPDLLTPEAVRQARPDPSFDFKQQVGGRLLDVMQSNLEVGKGNAPAPAPSVLSLLGSLQKLGGDVKTRAVDLSKEVGNIGRAAPQRATRIQAHPGLQAMVRPGPTTQLPATVQALSPIASELVSTTWQGTPDRPALSVGRAQLVGSLEPGTTFTNRITGRLGQLPSWLPANWFDDRLVQPIMAAPVFTRPMYEALEAYDRQWLIPGLAKLEEPDVVTMLVSNAEFIEAFFVGLSHELGRELLWRGYPTDMRGTYFRRFWNRTSDELAQQIYLFTPTPLGTHVVPTLSGRIVLFVRGELIRHYPHALVQALRAGGTDGTGHPIFIDPSSDPTATAPILFHEHLRPDIVLVGFDLTVDQVKTQQWWFVISEHPTAPRFGLAESRVETLSRDTMAWSDLPTVLGSRGEPLFLSAATPRSIPDSSVAGGKVKWGADSATSAHMLLRDPVRAAFDARTLLAPTGALQ
jgi:hypothetical protein